MSAQFETFGKYVLLEKLATGGMAEVFLARGTGAGGIGKFFAIKRILPQYADSPEFIEMFKDEAKIAINLNHSNIVSIHEFGVEKGQFFLVMDYVEGRNLRQILNKMKKSGLQFSIDQIVYVIKEVAAGLDHAHRCIDGSTGRPLNITHRDMSPQNLMASFEGEVKIVDFGIAKAESQIETTRAGTLKGKFGYMSPEQAEGQQVDLRTDIFSLGIVMWELFAHDRLFVANNEINTLRKIRDCQVPSLRKINPNIHTELERIAQKALARDRNLRYQTGAALHRDLNRFLNRQYPDFSPQDFSVFIKSVFADEILSLRKRLVEYTKVNLSISDTLRKPKGKDFDDRTNVLETGTNSLMVSDSQLSDGHNFGANATTLSGPDDDDDRTQATGDSKIASVPGIDSGEYTRTETGKETVVQKTRTNVLDENAIAAEMAVRRDNVMKPKIRVEPMTMRSPENSDSGIPALPSNSISSLETEEYRTPMNGTRRGPTRPPQVRTAKPSPARFATFLVFSLLCLSIYTYLCKFYPDMMEPAIKTTEPYLGAYYSIVLASREPATNDTVGSRAQPQSSVLDQFAVSPTSLIVASNPSGAEIFVDGESTQKNTPQMIDVPADRPFTLSLKRRGYHDYKRLDVTREALGHKVDANLEKMYVGYLDIEIFPPQQAILYINGKQVAMQRTVARDILVPANRPVKIRAESRNGDTYEEVTVMVPLDRRKNVRINPRKNARTPAGTPIQ